MFYIYIYIFIYIYIIYIYIYKIDSSRVFWADQVIFELVKYFPNYLSLHYETLFVDDFLKIDIFKYKICMVTK